MIPLPSPTPEGLWGFLGLTVGISLAFALFEAPAKALEQGISRKGGNGGA